MFEPDLLPTRLVEQTRAIGLWLDRLTASQVEEVSRLAAGAATSSQRQGAKALLEALAVEAMAILKAGREP